MKATLLVTLAVLVLPSATVAQTRYRVSGGEVSRAAAGMGRVDLTRLTTRIHGLEADQRGRIRVSGDSAQRIAMADYEWNGRVSSVEFDEEDSRLFWDVKIVPDSSLNTIVRYRVDASGGGILSIKEFNGVRGLARRP